jgi:hypothetical protein
MALVHTCTIELLPRYSTSYDLNVRRGKKWEAVTNTLAYCTVGHHATQHDDTRQSDM